MKKRNEILYTASIMAIMLSAYGCSGGSDDDCTKAGCDPGFTCNKDSKECEEIKANCMTDGCTTGFVCNTQTGKCDPEPDFDCRVAGNTCEADETCNTQTGKCDPKPAEDCTTAGCSGSLICNTSSKQCVECMETEDCASKGEDFICQNFMCRSESGNNVPVEKCPALTITDTSITCEKTGSGSKVVLRGDVLALDKTYEGGSVVFDTTSGKITYVGCEPDMNDAVVITCPDAVISPSLINGHEHITYSNGKPGTWGEERFDHRHDWRKGINGHKKVPGPGTDDNMVVELRAVMAGTTSIFGSVGSDSADFKGFARNLDYDSINGHVAAAYDTFPLSDGGSGTQATSGCSKYSLSSKAKRFAEDNSKPYGPHIGEGINQESLNELRCLSNGTSGLADLFKEKMAMVHGVSATPEFVAQMAQNNVSLIWSPRTNVSLYGDTAQVVLYDNMGVNIGLGTDWIYSGSANMLREFKCIDSLNTNNYGGHFSDYDLWRMPTYNNAVAFHLEDSIGSLKTGLLADIAVFRKTATRTAHRAVIDADNGDVLLVTIGGKFVYGDANLMSSGDAVKVCGENKKVNLTANGAVAGGVTFSGLQSAAQYPLFFCEGSDPANEPTCVPKRTRSQDTSEQTTTNYSGLVSVNNDSDGDGIADANDNCPFVFNPVRPQDTDRKQADVDHDGIGDACDEYPTCATNDSSCPKFCSNDVDCDGIINPVDNCSYDANPDQKDSDNDGIGDVCDPCDDSIDADNDGLGDACDACPSDGNNEDGKGCSLPLTTVKALRDAHIGGTLATGLIKTQGVVTAIVNKYDGSSKTGFFIQSTSNDAGVMIYSADYANKVKVGDLVTVRGETTQYKGLLEVQNLEDLKVESSNNAVTPVALTASQTTANTTDSNTLNPYDSMLVTVRGLTVGNLDTSIDKGNYYVCTDSNGQEAYLDDYVMGTTPFNNLVKTGDTYTSVTGILVYDYSRSKIAPRGAEDLVAGQSVKSITSSASTLDWGSEATITVSLSLPAEGDVEVAIACTNADCPEKVTVTNGETSATFKATLHEASASLSDGDVATVKATYEGMESVVEITGTDPAIEAAIASVTPDAVNVKPGSSTEITINMTKAVKADTPISLATDQRFVTVPASVTVAKGSDKAMFDLAVSEGAAADAKATVTVGEAHKVVVTVKDAASCSNEYVLDFKDENSSGYESKITKEYDNGMKVEAMAQFNDSNYKDAMVMTGNSDKQSYFTVSGLDGVCAITIDYVGYASDGGKLDIIVGDDKQTIDIEKSGSAGKQTIDISNGDAVSFTIQPPSGSGNGFNRIAVNSVTWTTNK